MATDAEVIVVGAGVVGLAIGRALAAAGREVLVLERHGKIGEETSSRNSGVIHSGIYYSAGSLKARLCVAGREQLYAYCLERAITHRRCGKLIVAQQHQVAALAALLANGLANGVTDLATLTASEVHALEPSVRCASGLLSPSTGVVDVHELMTSLLGDLEMHGGTLVTNTEVTGVRRVTEGFELATRNGIECSTVVAHSLVNSAGLAAVDLTRRIEGYPAARIPDAYLAKGNYFTCTARPFRRLVYPMPNDAGLGVHATLDLDGSVRFGPDVEWVDSIDYGIDEQRAHAFYAAIRDYWPGLPDGALHPAYSGVRPKIAGPGQKPADFVIAGPADHGLPGLVNLLGIESPGLTAALSIAAHVRKLLLGVEPGLKNGVE